MRGATYIDQGGEDDDMGIIYCKFRGWGSTCASPCPRHPIFLLSSRPLDNNNQPKAEKLALGWEIERMSPQHEAFAGLYQYITERFVYYGARK